MQDSAHREVLFQLDIEVVDHSPRELLESDGAVFGFDVVEQLPVPLLCPRVDETAFALGIGIVGWLAFQQLEPLIDPGANPSNSPKRLSRPSDQAPRSFRSASMASIRHSWPGKA